MKESLKKKEKKSKRGGLDLFLEIKRLRLRALWNVVSAKRNMIGDSEALEFGVVRAPKKT